MQNATLTDHKLAIEGMTGDACVQKVTKALKNVPGVTTDSVEVGSATISADDNGCKAACAAIDAAGYKVHEDKNNGSADNYGNKGANNSSTGANKPTTDAKTSSQSQSMNANGQGKTQQNNDNNSNKSNDLNNSNNSNNSNNLNKSNDSNNSNKSGTTANSTDGKPAIKTPGTSAATPAKVGT